MMTLAQSQADLHITKTGVFAFFDRNSMALLTLSSEMGSQSSFGRTTLSLIWN